MHPQKTNIMSHHLKEKSNRPIKTIVILILLIFSIPVFVYHENINKRVHKLQISTESMDIKIANNFKNQPITWNSPGVTVAKTSTDKPVIVCACDNGFGGTTESGTVIRFTKKMQLIAGTGPNNEPWFWLVNEDTSVMKIFPHIFRNKL